MSNPNIDPILRSERPGGRRGLRFFTVITLLLAACAPEIPTPPQTQTPGLVEKAEPQAATATSSVVEEWPPGEVKNKGTIVIDLDNQLYRLRLDDYTSTNLQINIKTLVELVDLFHQQRGVLPTAAEMRLVETDLPSDPEVPVLVNAESDLVTVNLGRALKHPEDLPDDYEGQAQCSNYIVQGLCGLMLPDDEDKTQRCRDYGMMVAATMMDKNYGEYTKDVEELISSNGSGGHLSVLDEHTFQWFKTSLPDTLIRFRPSGPPLTPSNL
jgi:hypothetical protein